MKKTFTILSFLSLSLAPAISQESGALVDTDAVNNYFVSSLAGTDSEFSIDGAIPADRIAEARELVWSLWSDAVDGYSEEKLIELDILENRKSGSWVLPSSLEPDATMPFYYGCNESPSFDAEKQYPLFLYMHGSGDKDQEWETGIGLSLRRFYSPAIYFVPQIPNAYGEYYRWAIQSKQWAWEKLLRLAFLSKNVNPNKIYFFGISEGAYGSQRLASFYADYLAGAGPMAGGEPLKNAPMENVANIAFSLRTGALDDGFGRNILTQKALEVADELEAAHPGYYNHNIEVIEGYGHSIDYKPTTPWLAQFTRDPHPDYFYWENYSMYGRQRDGFYNLKVVKNLTTSSTARACYEMLREGNTINLNTRIVNYSTSYSQNGIEMFFNKKYAKASRGLVRIYLNENEVNLSQPVSIVLNGEEIFNGMVGTSIKAMVESCALFFDPERLFPASIDIDIASKSAIPTNIESVFDYEDSPSSDRMYDLQGREVVMPTSKGIYIRNGQKVFLQ